LNNNNRLAILYALIAVAMWSTVATAFKLSLNHLSLLQLLTGASFFSLLTLTFFLIIRKEFLQAIYSLPSHWKQACILGGLNPILYYVILFKAYDLLPAQVAQSLNYTWAITLTIFSVIFLKHKLLLGDIVAITLGYTGVLLIILSSGKIAGDINIIGIFLAMISTLVWAAYWLINTKDNRPPITKLFHSFLFALPILVIACLVLNKYQSFFTWQPWPYVAYVGLFEMGLAFIFWQLALEKTNRIGQISTLIFLSPLISLFIINHVLGEAIQVYTIIGLALILLGIGFQQYYSFRSNKI
jgi:drug/metabolite transporter (DMT)-like permease